MISIIFYLIVVQPANLYEIKPQVLAPFKTRNECIVEATKLNPQLYDKGLLALCMQAVYGVSV